MAPPVHEEEVAARKRWGLPDWRDPTQYPSAQQANLDMWRWEFLRRHALYRCAWEQDLGDYMTGKWERAADLPDYQVEQWGRMARDEHFRRAFGLRAAVDPRLSCNDMKGRPPEFEKRMRSVRLDSPLRHGFREFELWVSDPHNHHLWAFDIRRPIQPQLEMVKSWLQAIQTRTLGESVVRRPKIEKWQTSLRVLDALECGFSYREIIDGIWPGNQKSLQAIADALTTVVRAQSFLLPKSLTDDGCHQQ